MSYFKFGADNSYDYICFFECLQNIGFYCYYSYLKYCVAGVCFKKLTGEHVGRRALVRPRRRWEDNISNGSQCEKLD